MTSKITKMLVSLSLSASLVTPALAANTTNPNVTSPKVTTSNATNPKASTPIIMGYYANWDTYSPVNYQPTQIPVSNGINVGLYAFTEVGNCAPPYATDADSSLCNKNNQNTGDQDYQLHSIDPYSDFNTIPSGYLDSGDSGLGNMSKFIETLHKNKENALLSIGGFSLSTPLTTIMTNGNYSSFDSSVVSFLNQAKSDNNGDGFDGVDIDWEPNNAQWTFLNNSNASTVLSNYINFLSDLQSQLQNNYASYAWLTVAVPANPAIINLANQIDPGFWKNVAANVDYMDVMAYDYHGPFDSPQITDFSSPLMHDANEPSNVSGGGTFNVQDTIQAYVNAGVSANKLILGAPLYGYAEANVPDVAPSSYSNAIGLYQSFSGSCSQSTKDSQGNLTPIYGNGLYSYNYIVSDLVGNTIKDYEIYSGTNFVGVGAYGNDSTNNCSNAFFTYDNVDAVNAKAAYVKSQGLAGMMFWELSQDLPSSNSNSLVGTAYSALIGSSSK